MVEQEEVYTLTGKLPWANFQTLALFARTSWTTQPIYMASKQIWDSQQNVRWAIIDAFNEAVPRKFKQTGGDHIGAQVCLANDNPCTILNNILAINGHVTPMEKTMNN